MMRKTIIIPMIAGVLSAGAQEVLKLQTQELPNPENEPVAVHPVPHERQVLWNETEFYAFFHYGMNTFTNREWGNGDEDVKQYAPTSEPNPRQWLEVAKSAGMNGGIAVVKHHDGFCLWPTETTEHNCTHGSGAYAATNIPQKFGEAARDLGMKYGFYISPWDRNSELYGTDRYVSEVFLRQCAEISQYGDDQFEMWFDGANGGTGYYGGANENRSIDNSIYYDIPNLRDSIHTVMPNCVMWGVGGEARWIGNEAGWAGETNWSYGTGTSGSVDAWEWFAGESDAKATNKGWFWHSGEVVLSLDRLWQMYMETVGRNATWILNLPPDQSGSIPEVTAKRMKEFGELLKERIAVDHALTATVSASETRAAGQTRNYEAANVTDGDKTTYWATNDGTTDATLTFIFPETKNVHYVSLMEYIRKGQRVKNFTIETTTDGSTWTAIPYANTTTIGYKRIVPLNGSTTNYGPGMDIKGVRIHITDAKACPLIHTVQIF
ncbi:MAG: alpha-L-fucosidase [Bacteroides sp.]|nr:alpha-L-fucosidase [Bacteroides sp.]MCM1378912.1 alpha-L-fucosidase [Bacteroides sp.]MCM1445528.1 alpha-L-fucosidase [Prevotella sp.]